MLFTTGVSLCTIAASGIKLGLEELYSLCNLVYKEGAKSFVERVKEANFECRTPGIA